MSSKKPDPTPTFIIEPHSKAMPRMPLGGLIHVLF
jgi:hypothetical protein